MCLDIQKYLEPIGKKKLDNIDNITRVINSYDINEFSYEDDEIDFNKYKKSTRSS